MLVQSTCKSYLARRNNTDLIPRSRAWTELKKQNAAVQLYVRQVRGWDQAPDPAGATGCHLVTVAPAFSQWWCAWGVGMFCCLLQIWRNPSRTSPSLSPLLEMQSDTTHNIANRNTMTQGVAAQDKHSFYVGKPEISITYLVPWSQAAAEALSWRQPGFSRWLSKAQSPVPSTPQDTLRQLRRCCCMGSPYLKEVAVFRSAPLTMPLLGSTDTGISASAQRVLGTSQSLLSHWEREKSSTVMLWTMA